MGGIRCRHIRAVLAEISPSSRAGSRRPQPLPGDTRRARDSRSCAARPGPCAAPLGGVPAPEAARSCRRRRAPTSPTWSHAIVDWDWELAAVTFAALGCGAAILVAARPEVSTVLSTRIRIGFLALVLPLIVLVVVGLVGNEATSSAKSAANSGNWRRVESKTQTAHRWAPWSATPLQLRAEAELAAGRLTPARREFERAVAKDSARLDPLVRARAGQRRIGAAAGAR